MVSLGFGGNLVLHLGEEMLMFLLKHLVMT